ncbi:hypothetical protein [Thalassotalea sp. PLHSN55]|uniref:hypothetical protein n=1 Tax=Thalassotalea sp. PLHSN55 TaxID=3435888 RepID=UPI003F86BFEE
MTVNRENKGRALSPQESQHKQLHKAMLYLILLDFVLILFCYLQLTSISLMGGSILSFFMVVYNTLVGRIVLQFTRRGNDGYILYPMIFCYLMLTIFIITFFVIQQ